MKEHLGEREPDLLHWNYVAARTACLQEFSLQVSVSKLVAGTYVLAIEALHDKNEKYLRQYHVQANVHELTKTRKGCADLILCACITKAIRF